MSYVKASRDELLEAFKMFDLDGDGEITIKELENLLVKLKTDPKHNQLGVQGTLSPLVREEIRALLKVADKDHSGAITFGEFHDLWEGLKSVGGGGEEEREIREEFNRMDVDGSGFISKDEMLRIITKDYTLKNMEDEAKKCLDEIDVDGDGRISYPEFLMVWKFKG